jgi:hypothetical protein
LAGEKIHHCFGITIETMDINDILGAARAFFSDEYVSTQSEFSMPRAFFNAACIFQCHVHFSKLCAFFNAACISRSDVHFTIPRAFLNAQCIFQRRIQFSMPHAFFKGAYNF